MRLPQPPERGSPASSSDPFLEGGRVDRPESSDQSFLGRDSCSTRGSPHQASCSPEPHPSPSPRTPPGLFSAAAAACNGGSWVAESSPCAADTGPGDDPSGGPPASRSVMAACRISAVSPSFRLDSDAGRSKDSSEMLDREPRFLGSARGSSAISAEAPPEERLPAARPGSESSPRRPLVRDMWAGLAEAGEGEGNGDGQGEGSLCPGSSGPPPGSTSMQ